MLIIAFLINSTNICMSCGVKFADYHCSKCNLWMDLSKKPFHCDKCGICRVGGKDNFSHCDQCCMCISVSVIDTHNCLKDKYKSKSRLFFTLQFVSNTLFSLATIGFCSKPIVPFVTKICFHLGKALKSYPVDMPFM